MVNNKSAKAVKFEHMTPILNVSDMQSSLAYYRDILGFSIRWQWGEPTGFACVARDALEIFLCENAQGQGSTWVSLFVDDVDQLHEEYLVSGAVIRQPPTNFPWGVREMNVSDPDGHCFRMGTDTNEEPDGVPLAE